jgi:hypothetical protein
MELLDALAKQRDALDQNADLAIVAFDAGTATAEDVAVASALAEGASLAYERAVERLRRQLHVVAEPITPPVGGPHPSEGHRG